MSRFNWLLGWLFLVTAVLVQAAAVRAADPKMPTTAGGDWRFGVIESYEAPGEADLLGAAWTRVEFNWAETQADGPETWTPDVSDAQISAEIDAGRLVTGLLIGIPDWAQDEKDLPRGLELPHDDPHNTWGTFVRQIVSRYNGRINHWIIWNEPDIGAGALAHTWNGSEADFLQLQRTAYLAAKESNANAVIHLAAFSYFADPDYFHRYLDAVAADPAAIQNRYYFDVATAHLYFQPNSIYDIIQSFYGAMAAHGIRKPIWLVETNAPPINDPEWPVSNWTLSVTLDEQAAFMPQAAAVALAAGAERIAVFKLKDTPTDLAANPEPFGLISRNGRRRPAFFTYQIALRYMAGTTAVTRERWNEVGQIRLEQEGQSTTVLFARLPAPQQAQVMATAETAVLVDMWGTMWELLAKDGAFTVDLPPALCTQSIGDYCMIGGTTYYLIQANAPGVVPQLPPEPLLTPPTATATATAAPTNTPTATVTSTAVPPATSTPSPSATPLPLPTADLSSTTVSPLPTGQPTYPPTNQPANQPTNQQTNPIAYWFLGAGLVLAVGLGIWVVNGRRRS